MDHLVQALLRKKLIFLSLKQFKSDNTIKTFYVSVLDRKNTLYVVMIHIILD